MKNELGTIISNLPGERVLRRIVVQTLSGSTLVVERPKVSRLIFRDGQVRINIVEIPFERFTVEFLT